MSNLKSMEAFGAATKVLEESGRKTPAFGIDLGTTNSCIAVVQSGNTPRIIELEGGRKTLPSCVMWKGKGRNFVVGQEAYKNRYKPSAIYSVKRMMGTDEKIELLYGTKNLVLTPAEVSSEILKELVRQASAQYKDIKDVVITVPAYFNNRQVADTLEAGKLAGLNVLNILREPTSAALIYEMENFGVNEERVLVYDLGGGTFDVSLLRVTRNQGETDDLAALYGEDISPDAQTVYAMLYSVLDTDGNSRLGGDDIDHEMLKIVLRKLEGVGIDISKVPNVEKEKILLRLERLKKSGPGDYQMTVEFKLKGGEKIKEDIHLTTGDFTEATRVIYKKTRALVNAVLERSGRSGVNAIVLVGGSTKSPIIKELLRRDFPDVTINDALNPDEAVALGASIKAKEVKFGDKNVEVFDVLPLSIGVVSSGNVRPIIRRNQRVPYSDTVPFTTQVDDQKQIDVHIYQGNSSLVDECLYLGSITLTGFPTGKAGEVMVYVTMTVDSNGLLKCAVQTGNTKKELELVNLFGRAEEKKTLSAEERRAKKWLLFADKLPTGPAQEVKFVVNQYLEGSASSKDVAAIIEKYSEFSVSVEAPTIEREDTYMNIE